MIQHIPNLLTALRGVFTALIALLFFIPFDGQFIAIYTLFLLAVLSDFLDGYLARRWNVVSTIGEMFDPLLDKVLTLALYMLLIPFNVIHAGVFIALLIRELLVDGMKNFMMSKGESTPAIMSAKIKTATQMLLIHFILLYIIFPETSIFKDIAEYLGLFTVLAAFMSGWRYTQKFMRFLQEHKS